MTKFDDICDHKVYHHDMTSNSYETVSLQCSDMITDNSM